MAIAKDTIAESFPIPVFQYKVEIEGLDEMAFSEVSGLNIEVEPITYKDGMSYMKGIQYMPGNRTPIKLTLKKGMTIASEGLYSWMNDISLNAVEKKNITIRLMNVTGDAPVVNWVVENASPTKLEGPSFNATSNEVAFESIEVIADRMTISR